MERQYIPQEAYQSYLRQVPTTDEREQIGAIDFSERIEQSTEYHPKRRIVQYELDFDRKQARKLLASKGDEGYEERVESFKSFTEMQLTTALGERFNRGLSTYTYKSREGILYGEHSEEPFLEVLERGRAYREINGNLVDFDRERAEVVGFAHIQEYMKDADPGSTAISVSQPGEEGSIYKHNFYDGFRKKEDGDIEVVRFSNNLNAQQTLAKLQELDSAISIPEDLSDVSLLSNPIIISPEIAQSLTLDKIHAHIHEEHAIMSEADFAVVQEMCTYLIVSYINSLLSDPEDYESHARLYNAILNKADEVADGLKYDDISYIKSSSEMSIGEMYYLGGQAVREVDTGCGLSGGMMVGESANGVFGVADFGMSNRFSTEVQDLYGGLEFTCPGCKKINKRPYGKFIKNCGEGQVGGCGRDVTC